MKYTLYLIFCISISSNTSAQQANNWYFGFNAGITFNTPAPTALLDGALFATEGCASISDNKGQILFYTDGITIYDRTHQPMPNGTGLHGGASAANAAIIIPQPGSESLYYVFTADEAENNGLNGYNYSIVDMSLNNGLGNVTSKNQFLYAPGCEQLTAIRHANGLDVWVVTKVYGNNEWRVYKIDCNGIDPVPVSSFAGMNSIGGVAGFVGNLKSSIDGKKMALGRWAFDLWELFDIDNATGIVSNPVLIRQDVAGGLEFSPDSKLLYVSGKSVVQYNITSSDPTTIKNSAVVLYSMAPNSNGAIVAMQLGPDGKIYWAIGLTSLVGTINVPNTPGIACDLRSNQIDLQGRTIVSAFPKFFPNLITDKTADFSFTISGDCSRVDFVASSSISGNLTFNWDFGDGQSGTGQQVSHTYANNAASVNKVKLTVISTYPCYAVITKEVDLQRLTPTAKFDAIYSCGKLNVQLSDKSIVPGGTISGWHWDFGDGQGSNVQNPSHTYAAIGEYTITLTVTTPAFCSSTGQVQQTIALEPKPIPAFNNNPVCAGKPVQFNNTSTIGAGSISEWKWIFGDGSSSSQENPIKIYDDVGDYPLKMVAKSSTGCISDTVYKTITVNDNPKAFFTVADTCFSQTALFHGEARVDNGNITEWRWQIDANEISNSQDPSWYFPQAGQYPVSLVVKANTGCVSEIVQRIVSIRPKPVAQFTVQDGCTQTPLKIVNNSTVDIGVVSSGLWDFGNGDTRQGLIPDYSYTSPGNYRILFKAISNAGCVSDPIENTVLIESIPTVDFTFNNACVGKPINFTNLSTNNAGAIREIKWRFGNGDVSTEVSPRYTYYRYGVYPVTLQHTTGNGCSASSTKNVSIEKTTIYAGNDTIAAIGQPLQLKATGAYSYQWFPGTYLNNSTLATPIALPRGDITYYITGTTVQGCIGYDTLHIKTYKGPAVYVPNAFTPAGNNKVFRPVLVGISELDYFSVYNRWGQMIFTTKEMRKGWDGKRNGQDQPAGTYVWLLKAKDYLGNVHQERGIVILIR